MVAVHIHLRQKYPNRVLPPAPSIQGPFLEKFVALLRVRQSCSINTVSILESLLEQFLDQPLQGKTLEETRHHYLTTHQSPEIFYGLLESHPAFDHILIKTSTSMRRINCNQRCPLPNVADPHRYDIAYSTSAPTNQILYQLQVPRLVFQPFLVFPFALKPYIWTAIFSAPKSRPIP